MHSYLYVFVYVYMYALYVCMHDLWVYVYVDACIHIYTCMYDCMHDVCIHAWCIYLILIYACVICLFIYIFLKNTHRSI